MSTTNTVEIKKRSSEELACWRVEVSEELTPNTTIDNSANLTLLVKLNGASYFCGKPSFTLYSLEAPGKKTKLIGGNKPYKTAEIIAIDQSSEFSAEWGIAGPNAIPSHDIENDVDCKVVAFGQYFYKIENYYSFFGTLPFDSRGRISRDSIREFLRGETTGIIKSYLATVLAGMDLRDCQSRLTAYNDDIKREINKHLEVKGLTVYNFVIDRLSYDNHHGGIRSAMDEAKMGVKYQKILNEGKKAVNEGKLDDLSVREAEIKLDIMRQQAEAKDVEARSNAYAVRTEAEGDYMAKKNGTFFNNREPRRYEDSRERTRAPRESEAIFCSQCGTRNEDATFCKKCGARLLK